MAPFAKGGGPKDRGIFAFESAFSQELKRQRILMRLLAGIGLKSNSDAWFYLLEKTQWRSRNRDG